MVSPKMLVIAGMTSVLVLPLAACSNSVKLSSARMCTAAGGTYTAGTCNSGAATQKTGAQMCQAHGGVYDPALDMCEMAGSGK
jgi:hypothetical protein